MNRNLDMHPHAQGLSTLRDIAVRRTVLAELLHLRVIDPASDLGRIVERRQKELHEAGEVARLQAIRDDQNPTELRRAAAMAQASPVSVDPSPPARRSWRDRCHTALRRFVGRPR